MHPISFCACGKPLTTSYPQEASARTWGDFTGGCPDSKANLKILKFFLDKLIEPASLYTIFTYFTFVSRILANLRREPMSCMCRCFCVFLFLSFLCGLFLFSP